MDLHARLNPRPTGFGRIQLAAGSCGGVFTFLSAHAGVGSAGGAGSAYGCRRSLPGSDDRQSAGRALLALARASRDRHQRQSHAQRRNVQPTLSSTRIDDPEAVAYSSATSKKALAARGVDRYHASLVGTRLAHLLVGLADIRPGVPASTRKHRSSGARQLGRGSLSPRLRQTMTRWAMAVPFST